MLIYAHRGWSSNFPENTLRAFAEAIALGVSGIELDVQLTQDGIPVVIHDQDLARTTNGRGRVDEVTLLTLQALDAGGGEGVPTLKDVLELVGDSVHLDIEIKAPGAGEAVLNVLRRFPRARWAASAFDWRVLRDLREMDSGIALWPLAVHCDDALLAVAADLSSPTVALAHDSYTVDSAQRLREAGLRAFLWTVNEPTEAERVQALGVYALCTDDPSRFVPA